MESRESLGIFSIPMTSSERALKRGTIIGLIVFFVALFWSSWYFLTIPDPTCFDKRQNQDEDGIDCGGSCGACVVVYTPEDIVVREATFVPSGEEGVYDILGAIYNPNDELGAASFTYTFQVKGSSGEILAEAKGRNFILPQETKTLLAIGVRSSSRPQSVHIVFSDATWEKFSGYQEKPVLSIRDKRYEKVTNSPFFSEATGTLSNDSLFDFGSISVKVILRDVNGRPVAFNQTEMNTVLSKEERDFRLRFPRAFPGEVATIEVEPEADIYHSENFIKRYIGTGKFQERESK